MLSTSPVPGVRRHLTYSVIPFPGRCLNPPLLQLCFVITTVRKVRIAACYVRPGVCVSLESGLQRV